MKEYSFSYQVKNDGFFGEWLPSKDVYFCRTSAANAAKQWKNSLLEEGLIVNCKLTRSAVVDGQTLWYDIDLGEI